MGCDIHLFFEEKNHHGKWQKVDVKPSNILPDDRYYHLWAFLFDVRNSEFDDHPFDNRGLPKDSSFNEDLDEEGGYHSITYIRADEVKGIEWPDDLKDCYFRIFCEWVLPRIANSWSVDPQHIRMIIGFDN